MTLVLIGKGLLLEGSKPQNKGQTCSRYIYIYLQVIRFPVLLLTKVPITCRYQVIGFGCDKLRVETSPARWTPTSYRWRYNNPYKRIYKHGNWGEIHPEISGVMSPYL